MNTTKPTATASSPTKTETKSLDVKPPVDKTVHREIDKKSFLSHSKGANNAKVEVKTIEIQAKKYKKKAKNVKVKIIRDSFPFPEKDYVILSELKKVCIADGLPVKRGEILRTGLQLLTKLTLPELKLALEKVEKIPARPAKTSKNYVTKH
jgi:hypothetical protein